MQPICGVDSFVGDFVGAVCIDSTCVKHRRCEFLSYPCVCAGNGTIFAEAADGRMGREGHRDGVLKGVYAQSQLQ